MPRVLIATEGSLVSQEAIRHFTRLLNPEPVEICILSVIMPAGIADDHPSAASHYHREAESAQEAIDLAITDLNHAGFRAFGVTRVGEPATVIVEVAKELDVELIVLGTHARHGLKRLFKGSVAERVLHHAPCGVYIYPQVAEEVRLAETKPAAAT